MKTIPSLLRNTGVIRRIRSYMETEFDQVMHTTLNPEGPGAIRIHLIPPREEEDILGPSVAIINGTDIIPVNFLWAIMLCETIKEINVYDGRTVSEEEIRKIPPAVAEKIKKLVWFLNRKSIEEDIRSMFATFRQIAAREPVTANIRHLNIGEYADLMRAPHRMDLMVSAMTREGRWNCNLKCVHCYAAGQACSDEKEISTDEWKKILDRLRKIGVPQVTFTGGEPTMREDLPVLIKYARWFISRLNTNGIRLTEEYCRELRKAELDSVQITLYSADAAVHNILVGADGFERTAAGIDNALKAGLSLSINTPLCTLNKNYTDTLRWLHEKGVIYVTCSGLITTGNAAGEASEKLQLSQEEITEVLREAAACCAENGMELAFTSPGWIDEEVFAELGLASPACGACLSNMAVTPSGNVVPCQSWLSDEPLGSLLTDAWEDIWDGQTCMSCRNYAAEMTGKCPLRRYCR